MVLQTSRKHCAMPVFEVGQNWNVVQNWITRTFLLSSDIYDGTTYGGMSFAILYRSIKRSNKLS